MRGLVMKDFESENASLFEELYMGLSQAESSKP